VEEIKSTPAECKLAAKVSASDFGRAFNLLFACVRGGGGGGYGFGGWCGGGELQ